MKEFLGVDVPDDAHGVLQDVHLLGGGIGYFPTYALGNVISLQLWDVGAGARAAYGRYQPAGYAALPLSAGRQPRPGLRKLMVKERSRSRPARRDLLGLDVADLGDKVAALATA